jgi:EAL domain-containing protein (putative c-di-GMP-specific phosphodiesterase class I)
VDLRSGELAGFEVLARWRSHLGAEVVPSVFIPLAETSGLIWELTDRVVHAACDAAAAWPPHLTLSVNVSPVQLGDQTLLPRLRSISHRTGFPLDRVVLEITESALIGNPLFARRIIEDIKAAGPRIALDDFGTAYSSLRQLQLLPFDRLKIDASFVREMAARKDSRKIVAAVVGLGLSLGLTTVAEGVETQAQANMLTALGCDLAQGWWFGKAISAEETLAGLRTQRWNRRSVGLMSHLAYTIAARLEASPASRLAQLRAIYDAAPVGLALLSTDLRYVSINQRLAEMHGLPVEAHLGAEVASIIPAILPRILPHLRTALLGEPVIDVQLDSGHAPTVGGARTFLASYCPVRNEEDGITGISVAVVETTGRTDRRRAHPAPDLPSAGDTRVHTTPTA